MIRIYADDPLVSYSTTIISPERTRAEVTALLEKWGAKYVEWMWQQQNQNVAVQFKISETINGVPITVPVKIQCPLIYSREHVKTGTPEAVNWSVSMRQLWWFLKTHLEMRHAMQQGRIEAFMPYVTSYDGKRTLAEVIIPRLANGKFPELERR
jgi:hypothetical protein